MLGAGRRERRYPSSRMLIGGDDGYDKRRYCLQYLCYGRDRRAEAVRPVARLAQRAGKAMRYPTSQGEFTTVRVCWVPETLTAHEYFSRASCGRRKVWHIDLWIVDN